MKNKAKEGYFQKSDSLRSLIVVLAIPFAVYMLYVQLFVGFIQFGYQTVDTGEGASFAQILEDNKDRAISSSIYKISENELLSSINLNGKKPKYLAFNVNYMDSDDATVKISFKENDLEVAQDQFTFSQGISYYKIPKIGSFNEVEFYIVDKQTITLGMNGISTLSALGMNNSGLFLAFLVLILLSLGRIVLKKPAIKDFAEKLVQINTDFRQFMHAIRIEFFLLLCVGILGYGFFCTNFTLSIDEELFWMIKDGSPWVGYGRYGNYFLDKYLTFDSSVIPFFTDVLAVMMLILASLIFSYSFFKENVTVSKNNVKYTIFGGLFLTFPFVNGDFMAFSVYNLWIALAYVFTAIAIVILREFQTSRKKLELGFAVLTLTSAISIYQSFISVFVVMFLILELQKLITRSNYMVYWRWAIAGITLLTSTGLYLILNALTQRIITPAYGYLGSLVGWNKGLSPFQVLDGVFEAIVKIYLGSYGSSGRILTISVSVFLVYVFCISLNQKSIRQRTGVIFLASLLLIAPFLTALALGSMLPARSLNGLSLLVGGIWLVILHNVTIPGFRKVFVATSALLLFFQIQFLNSLFYGDYLRYQEDIFMGRQLIHQIETQGINYRQYPIVFLGQHKFDSTKLISKINSGGRSFFDDSSQPYRMTYFLKTLGYQVILPTEADAAKALKVEPMKIWPESGSIVFKEDLIIVKLSH